MNASLIQGNSLHIPLADKSIHCAVTSPPYYSLRDYGVDGQIGMEQTPDAYVANMVQVFREVYRVLRDDGTLWLNIGDSYAGSGGAGGDCNLGGLRAGQPRYKGARAAGGLKPKDLMGIPWRMAFALQGYAVVPFQTLADWAAILDEALIWQDWELVSFVRDMLWYTSLFDRIDLEQMWLRSDIIWHKPNPTPESVTDRPTKSHEYLFLLAKSQHYYYDADAIKEVSIDPESFTGRRLRNAGQMERMDPGNYKFHGSIGDDGKLRHGQTYPKRNKRTVWTVAPQPFKGAHFATFPPGLIEPCIRAGTSERGVCPECGAPWKRVVRRDLGDVPEGARERSRREALMQRKRSEGVRSGGVDGVTLGITQYISRITEGWEPTCGHGDLSPVPARVFDPFSGAGTTLLVAQQLGRHGIGVDLNMDYLRLSEDRLGLRAVREWRDGRRVESNLSGLPLWMRA